MYTIEYINRFEILRLFTYVLLAMLFGAKIFSVSRIKRLLNVEMIKKGILLGLISFYLFKAD